MLGVLEGKGYQQFVALHRGLPQRPGSSGADSIDAPNIQNHPFFKSLLDLTRASQKRIKRVFYYCARIA